MIVAILLLLASQGLSDVAAAKPYAGTELSGNVCTAGQSDFRGSKHCQPTEHAGFDVKANHYFAWRSGKNAFLWLGMAEKDSRAQFDPSAVAVVSLRIRHLDSRDLAGRDTTLTLRGASGTTWVVPFTLEKIDQLRLLAVPADMYDIAIATPGYVTAVRRRVTTHRGLQVEVPPIEIERLPRITGVVRDGVTGQPVAGAEIEMERVVSSSDTAGRFALSPSSSNAGTVTVRASGYATRDVPVTLTRVGAELQPIFMTRGATLRIEVTRECDENCETIACLFEKRDLVAPSERWRELERKMSAGRTAEYAFGPLSRGSYAVLLEGNGPLQRTVAYFAIDRDEPKALSLTLRDRLLKGIVAHDKLPLVGAKLTFSTNQPLWAGELTTDDKGEYAATVWQGGNWSMKINVPAERERFFSLKSLDDVAEQYWDVSIPAREITGRVIDAKTREPVVGADVTDDVVSSAKASRRRYCVTDTDGRFRFPMVDAGDHVIHVDARGFIDRDAPPLEIAETDAQRDVLIALDRGMSIVFRVADPAGNPIANAEVYDWVGSLGLENHAPYISDAWGLVSIPMLPGQQKPVYVITRAGSFNVLLADSSAERTAEKPIEVTMPPPVAALTLAASGQAGPAAGVQFLVRVDGRFLPPRIWDLITGSLGIAPTMTGQDGRVNVGSLPAGSYEFWPYRTLDELRQLFRSLDERKPKRAVLGPGANVVEIPLTGRQ